MKIIIIIFGLCLIYKAWSQRIRTGHNHLSIFFGVPGCGKTTLASCYARKYMKKGFKVYSNVPIKGTIQYNPVEDLGVHQIENALIILDEASIEFNNRKFKSFPDTCIQFFKLHRHYHTEILVFSQSWNDCDATIRRLAFQYYLVRPSLIPYFVQAVPIRRKIGINETTNQPDDIYSFYPLLLRPLKNRNFFAPLAWKLFDSWEAPTLKGKNWQTYGVYMPLNQKLKKMIKDKTYKIRGYIYIISKSIHNKLKKTPKE